MEKCITSIPNFIHQWGFELQLLSKHQTFFNNSTLGIHVVFFFSNCVHFPYIFLHNQYHFYRFVATTHLGTIHAASTSDAKLSGPGRKN